MSVAVTSLPVPLSPVTSTVLSLFPITRRNSNTARIPALLPTTTESIVSATGFMASSEQTQRLEFGDLVAEGGFDAEIQRHVGARAPGAHAGEPYVRRIAIDLDELDIAAIRLHEGPDALQHRFD